MTRSVCRRFAALMLGMTYALTCAFVARAQTLNIPVESQIRPIQTSVLFTEFFSDFFHERDGTTYVQTGDIPAMWLRDSAAQTIPYIRFVSVYPALRYTFFGVLQRDAKNVLVDPHAEAFSADYHVWEDKWEIDSLAWPVLLALVYYVNTHDRTIFTPKLHQAMRTIVATYQCEQRHAACSHYVWPHPVPTHETYNPDTGMIWSGFRPSDDPVIYRFNIPQNMFAVVAMRLLSRFAREAFGDDRLANDATTLAAQVQVGIERYGRIWSPSHGGWMYVYETDGYGNVNLMDDANMPNLTAMPNFGWCADDDPVYRHTRSFTLSGADPYYYSGKYATGLGSPHTPKGWVWPLGIIGAAFSASKAAEVESAIKMLDQSDTLNGLMHESVNPNDPSQFTRPGIWVGQRVLGRPSLSIGRRVSNDVVRRRQYDRSARIHHADAGDHLTAEPINGDRRAQRHVGVSARAAFGPLTRLLGALALISMLPAMMPAPARSQALAQSLSVPLTGSRARSIATADLFHTLLTDFFLEDDETTYVQTGDIPAMWMRDSSAQTIPYVRFQQAFPILRERFAGVIERNARNILTDAYANAFQADYHVWERKWEIDSLAWPVVLTWVYWRATRDRTIFTPELHVALRQIVFTYQCEEHHRRCNRYDYPYPVPTDDRYNDGTGMIWSAFRPSDDPVQYRFNIPQNALAAVALREIEQIAQIGYGDAEFDGRRARACGARRARRAGLRAILQHPTPRVDVRLRNRRVGKL